MKYLGKTAAACLALAMAAILASCASRPPRSAAELAADQKIESAVNSRLSQDPRIYAWHIEVSAYKGVVTLSGFVTEASELAEAMQVAARVPGVLSVEDDMELQMFGRGGGSSGHGP